MVKTAKISVKDEDLPVTLKDFFKSILLLKDIHAILVPQHLPMKNVVMPTLVTDPAQLEGADPLAPSFPMNSAKIASRLTRRPSGEKIAAVLRPCEIRAFIELVKLKQASLEDVILLGIDCLGAYNNLDYIKSAETEETEFVSRFCQNILSEESGPQKDMNLSSACRACEYPVPDSADILIGLYGIDIKNKLMVQAMTPKGEKICDHLDLAGMDEPPERAGAIKSLVSQRTAFRDKMFSETFRATNSLEKLTTYLAGCINCYNCRVACPVCYCKECVFVTDVFNHEPVQYLRWAHRKGVIKMPTDTVFYHITRIAHMSTACVGCGQCSNACPNNIPVMELFRTASYRTQNAFDYEPGRSVEDEPPLSVFREDELNNIVGIGK